LTNLVADAYNKIALHEGPSLTFNHLTALGGWIVPFIGADFPGES
jgi:hypothetical protein